MKYYLIAGEPSGDLHGSNLIKGLLKADPEARLRFWGGDLMAAAGGEANLAKHYRETSFFGIVQVLKNLRTIKRQMRECRADVAAFAPDVLILVDYPGFNIKMARWAKEHGIRTFYYIAPKVWAWREWRVKAIRRYVDRLFVIFPFECGYFPRHGVEPIFEGNPLVDAIEARRTSLPSPDEFRRRHGLDRRPIIALLAGSRRGEIRDNLPLMADLSRKFPEHQFVVAGVAWLDRALYEQYMAGSGIRYVCDQTYETLRNAVAAVVTTGRLEVLTRSVTAELTAATDAIGIFRKEDTGKGYEPVHNRKYTYGTPLWETDGEEVVLIDEPAELTAYYPYREDGASSVGLSSELYVASKEIYYCPFKASNSTGPITLNLRRAYTLLRFNFIRGIADGTPTSAKGEYTGDGKISSFTFKATLRIAGILDLFTGTVEGEAREVAFNYNVPISIGTTTAPAVLDYMVVPSDFTGELSFTLMVDGKEMKGKISASDLCGTSGKLAEGTKYEINAIIRPTEVEIGTVEVEEWIGEVVKDPSGDPFVPE